MNTSLQVYRFNDKVAMYVSGVGGTIYLPPELAEEFANAILNCAYDIQAQPIFHKSTLETWRHE